MLTSLFKNDQLLFHRFFLRFASFRKGTITGGFRLRITIVQSTITKRRAGTGATGVLDFAKTTKGRVAIDKVVARRKAPDSLNVLCGIINHGHRIAIGDNVECVLVEAFHGNRRVQCIPCNDGIWTRQTNRRCTCLRTRYHCQTALKGYRLESQTCMLSTIANVTYLPRVSDP